MNGWERVANMPLEKLLEATPTLCGPCAQKLSGHFLICDGCFYNRALVDRLQLELKAFVPPQSPQDKRDGIVWVTLVTARRDEGKSFLDMTLRPLFIERDTVVMLLDAAEYIDATFINDSFGQLVRERGLEAAKAKLQFDAVKNRHYIPLIESIMSMAASEKKT